MNNTDSTQSEPFESLTVSVQNAVGHITLNKPDSLNSMTPAFWRELPNAVTKLDDSGDVRAIIISSTGKHFSAGMDLAVFAEMANGFSADPARRAEKMRREVLALQACFNVIESARVPVIGAVQGGAIGGAVDLLCACDIRVATEDAFFTVKETQIGMTADLGTLQRLPKLIPVGLAKELAYTGRNFTASEAKQCGFVNTVYASHEQMIKGVTNLAAQIAANSPVAVMGTKRMINYAVDHSIADSLEYMATWQTGMFQMEDVQKAIAAQKSGKAPAFDPLFDATTDIDSMAQKKA